MIELKPNTYNKFLCPECKNNNIKVIGIIFQGIHVLADCKCNICNFEFYHDFPVGHALLHPIAIGKINKSIYGKNNVKWFSKPLKDLLLSKSRDKIKIEKKIFFDKKGVVILNCMDYLYGHVLLKLFNAQYYIDNCKQHGVIIIIPKIFEWLLPEGISEAWIVDIGLKETQNRFIQLEDFVKKEFERFDKIYLSLAFSHPDPSKIDIERFTKIKRFDLDKFLEKKINITFITREDRLWFNSKFELFIYKILRKLKLIIYFNKYFVYFQNELISKTCKQIINELPSVNFNVVGLGRGDKFIKYINDYRERNISKEVEIKWCKIYSKSHIVIGIHGSNMLLPTALAAGFIEILPKNRYGNIIQDIFLPYKKRELFYLGRFAREFATPDEIASQAISIIKHFVGFNKNMNDKYLRHKIYHDVSRFSK